MDLVHWIEASLVVLGALALSVVCIRFRIGSGEFLCTNCRYNSADLCQKSERPTAISCTSYRQGPPGPVGETIEEAAVEAVAAAKDEQETPSP